MSWPWLLALAAGCYAQKALGMLGLGRARADGRVRAIGALLPPALLAALIGMQTLGPAGNYLDGPRIAGVVAGGVAAWRRAPFWLVIVIAAAVAGTLRRFEV